MGMTLFAVGALVAPLLGEMGRNWLGRNTTRSSRPITASGIARGCAPRPIATAHAQRLAPRPLRVVPAADPMRPPASAGLLVISGRMADVCAELDRLAALEAAAAHV